MKLKKLAQLMALIGVVSPALAQEAAPQSLQRVEVTGSSIKRVANEGALPVQIISYDQIEKQGITSAEQLLSIISSNGTGADNMTSGNNVFGADADRVSGGASFASLRGLGPNSTLVLLNGRRIATHGASGKAVDLNSIPMGAIARVEILKDGASAIYGTDAIGGVINFILKTNYNGLEVSGTTNSTQAGGGMQRRASLLAGHGNLEEDRYNIMVSLTADNDDKLSSNQRKFANGFQPGRGLSPDTTGTPYANQLSGAGTALQIPDPKNPGKFIGGYTLPGDANVYLQANPLSFQGKCDTISGMSQYQTALWSKVTSPLRSTYSCAYDYGGDYVISFPVERVNLLSRGTFKLAADHTMFVELLGSRTKATAEFTPMQIQTTVASGGLYPVGGAYYQDLSAYISTFDKTKPISYKWRANDFGNRTQENTTDNIRLLVGFEGSVGRWDYKAGVSHAESKTNTKLTDGYAYTAALFPALASGIINPWVGPGQTQTDAAKALIESTKFRGDFQHGKTTLTGIDGSLSGEVMQLPAGPLSAAVGFDLRRESYAFGQDIDATTVYLSPGNAALDKASRNVKAVYAELLVPIVKDLEMQLALRRDDYSLVGATTNPKVSFRYQPASWLLFRGSANKGFLAPSFTQLYSGQLYQELSSGVIDTVGCARHPGDPAFCAPSRLNYFSGGNPNLKPETSKQGSLGMVIEPFKGYSASLDYWAINSKDRILNRSATIVLQNAALLPQYIIRNPDDTINYVQGGWINAAGSRTRGADLSLRGEGKVNGFKWNATLDGTWTQSFKFAEIAGQEYKEYVGNFYTRDLYLRWKHNATFSLSRGDWSGLLAQKYSSGYKDQVPNGGALPYPVGFNPDVSSYTTYSLSGTYTGFKNTTITVGIQNLFDRDPPFTAHNVDDVVGAGWDPRVADPRGRALSFQVKYKFL
ncbi:MULTISPECIES: TonB-dependent receptor [unclassified Janthinobacterium]|uniref:TonB-dependent receptor n=1 Tax=unclassified Janthinobacterium TaxID=2610881 RepID=UPI00161DC843|nr:MULTISPECIES: TonB-dependent receptor [unclassified Janthinobacterium]MBB5371606.1 iron complex outermembrane receptor protein [Janthinobacterium sp. K2C7]MBB5384327.1 iron complex outermembrane receptor protein [Janthinobacterium sp. K2Li3]MBB5389602.1 iron complex outermembrane receptor protein [Janthinobacterium sp. K2E3]